MKKTITERVSQHRIDPSKNSNIGHLLVFLTDAFDAGATEIEYEFDFYWGESEVDEMYLHALKVREETDEEYSMRISLDEERVKLKERAEEQRELELYTKLKNKYEFGK